MALPQASGNSASLPTLDLPKKIGVVLFPQFQGLDVVGPLDVFQAVSQFFPELGLEVCLLSTTLYPVSTTRPGATPFGWSVVPTHTFETAPPDIDVLFVPGGLGTRMGEDELGPARAFIRKTAPNVRYVLTVCTGSALAASAGILDGRKATTNKAAWKWATSQGPAVRWVPEARWVVDGNIWTSSGIAAGIDMAYAWVAHVYNDKTTPRDLARAIAERQEYERHMDANWDPFAKIWGVTDEGIEGTEDGKE